MPTKDVRTGRAAVPPHFLAYAEELVGKKLDAEQRRALEELWNKGPAIVDGLPQGWSPIGVTDVVSTPDEDSPFYYGEAFAAPAGTPIPDGPPLRHGEDFTIGPSEALWSDMTETDSYDYGTDI